MPICSSGGVSNVHSHTLTLTHQWHSFANEHFNIRTGVIWDQTADFQTREQPPLPPQPPRSLLRIYLTFFSQILLLSDVFTGNKCQRQPTRRHAKDISGTTTIVSRSQTVMDG